MERFREIYRRAHADHAECVADEWLTEPCRLADGRPAERPLVWSRRNGPWRRVDVLWVGAAPGNAGGRGAGGMGAHATRIPFGGDVAGANLDLLLESIGLDRNATFIVAALNQLPEAGGGEPRVSELRRAVGAYRSSAHLLRDTILAAGPRLLVALGNVAVRTAIAAARLASRERLMLPGLARLGSAGLTRGEASPWPEPLPPDPGFLRAWSESNGDAPLPQLLWLLHPSAQNMSPYAGRETVFHSRMVETRAALRAAVAEVIGDGRGADPSAAEGLPGGRESGIYALAEWREAIGPRHRDLIRLWREKGL
ncbi:MAG TPA: uracil-DNA glycosylase family protein [Longimicrobiales bacterium]|nr:uracil-DNA glycosylase family protein [Longimicrobiales bacterium]